MHAHLSRPRRRRASALALAAHSFIHALLPPGFLDWNAQSACFAPARLSPPLPHSCYNCTPSTLLCAVPAPSPAPLPISPHCNQLAAALPACNPPPSPLRLHRRARAHVCELRAVTAAAHPGVIARCRLYRSERGSTAHSARHPSRLALTKRSSPPPPGGSGDTLMMRLSCGPAAACSVPQRPPLLPPG